MAAMATNSGTANGGKEYKNNNHIDAAVKAKKQSFKKRKGCVMKKSMELSVLCGIKVCAIIVEPYGKIETWPENKDDVMEIVKLYQDSSDDKKSGFGVDHQVVSDLQHELDDVNVDSWIEGLSETSVNEFLTELGAKMNVVRHRIDILKRTTTMIDDDYQMNDHSLATAVVVSACDGEKAVDHSINDPINFFMVDDDQMNDIIMPAALVVYDGEEAMEQRIKDQNQINPTSSYDDQQNIDKWLNKLPMWNGYEEDCLMLDSDFW